MPGPDKIDASPTDIRRLAKALEAFQQDVSTSAKRAQGALTAANWNDSRKTQFEASFRELRAKLDAYMGGEVSEMVQRLYALAGRLDDVRNVRM